MRQGKGGQSWLKRASASAQRSTLWDPHSVSAKSRKNRRIVLFSLVGLLVLLTLTVVIISSITGKGTSPGATDTAGPAAAATTAPAAGPAAVPTQPAPAAGSCPLDDGADITLSAPAAVAQWEVKGTAKVPVVSGPGPCTADSAGAFHGFAHSMTGALYAAQWYAGALEVSGTVPGAEARIKSSVADLPGRENMIALAQAVAAGTGPMPGERDINTQTAGYQIHSYTPENARIFLAVANGRGLSGINVFQVSLSWADGDWKLVPTLSGGLYERAPGQTLEGFVPWGSPGFPKLLPTVTK